MQNNHLISTRKHFYKFILTCIIALFFFSSCHRTKEIEKTSGQNTTPQITTTVSQPPAKIQAVLNSIHNNELNFSEMGAKMKTKVTWDNRTQSCVTQLRWKKGSKMWMSMTVIGIEGGRVLVNKDSVKVIDRLNQRNIIRPIAYVKQKTGVDLSFSDIEKIFLAQLFLVDTVNMQMEESADKIILKSNGQRFVGTIVLDKSYLVKNINITDNQYKQTIQADYDNYETVGQKPFPMHRYLKIVSGSYIFELDANFQSVDITKKLSYPFELNSNYKME